MKTIVKKYGGATLADPEKIKAVALDLRQCHQRGEKLLVVVSAMGQTTNELIQLAHQVSHRPKRREMDMLLTTGERISMSLLSMALNDLHCPAISFTGSQAGVLTDDSHLNAFITEVNSPRVREALSNNQIVIIAGFQGVSPKTKEVTTLGRGGSDTTAVAMAAALKAHHCEILKDVSGVYSADPKICPTAQQIHQISYQQMLEMTFWGAKVLHYRSVELASQRGVPVYIGPAHNTLEGTWIKEKETAMFEKVKILSINSHADVLQLNFENTTLSEGLTALQDEFKNKEISFPQLLTTESMGPNHNAVFLTGPQEILSAIRREIKSFKLTEIPLATVTATCTGASTPEIATLISNQLAKTQIEPLRLWMSGMSCTLLVKGADQKAAIAALHDLVMVEIERS
jgi:aspartate kinase